MVRSPTAAPAWTRWFVVAGAVLGLAFVFLTPVLEGTDEAAHVSRVAMIETGQVIPPKTADRSPGNGADACITAYLYRHRAEALAGRSPYWADQFRNPRCAPVDWSLTGFAHTADVYSPVPYLPALVGFRLGRAVGGAAGSIYGARLVQLVAFVALMAFAIHRTPWGKPLLFTIGLLPVVIQGAANVSADPLTLALACCATALVLASIDRARIGEAVGAGTWWTFAAVGLGLALSKSAYVPFVLLLLAVPTAAFGTLRRRLAIGVGTLATTGIIAGLWNFGVVAHVQIDGVNRSNSDLAAAWVRRHPVGFLQAIVRGWANPHEHQALLTGVFVPVRRWAHNFPIPIWLGFLWLLAVRVVDPLPRRLAGLIDRSTHGRRPGLPAVDAAAVPRRERIIAVVVALGVAGACVLLIEYGLAIAANPPGARSIIWVQGRYFLPLVPLTLFGVSGVQRPVPRRRLVLIPVVSVTVVMLWIWWASSAVWGWI